MDILLAVALVAIATIWWAVTTNSRRHREEREDGEVVERFWRYTKR